MYNRADLKSPLLFNNLYKSAKVEPNEILELRRDIDWELENPGFSGKSFKVSFSDATTPKVLHKKIPRCAAHLLESIMVKCTQERNFSFLEIIVLYEPDILLFFTPFFLSFLAKSV